MMNMDRSDVPKQQDYIAMDASGRWYWYANQPSVHNPDIPFYRSEWKTHDDFVVLDYRFFLLDFPKEDWEESLMTVEDYIKTFNAWVGNIDE